MRSSTSSQVRSPDSRAPVCGPVWATGHLGSEKISLIGTDPQKHAKYAWKVCETIDGQGVVRRAWRNVKVKGHAEEVLAAVEAL